MLIPIVVTFGSAAIAWWGSLSFDDHAERVKSQAYLKEYKSLSDDFQKKLAYIDWAKQERPEIKEEYMSSKKKIDELGDDDITEQMLKLRELLDKLNNLHKKVTEGLSARS